ncbi:hypothetical protein VTN77DRAFT_4970 [Rasamsonia byssochlamydoides]|uniref:uncharacterized protein n=1 Tax=Rasamsonia byssochlamydoides TaxID=89139 RepID=UPI003743FF28
MTVEGAAATVAGRSLFVAQTPVDPNTGRPKIQKVLIANRGEIACRIIATCRKLSLTSVAVYVEEDKLSQHVVLADEAVNIGSIERNGRNPFLDIDLLVQTAVSVGAQAIHPGYGYLSENAQFAEKVRQAGLIFIGPSPAAMSTLGDKRASKAYLREHAPDVPLIPGFAGSSQEVEDLEKAAAEIGFPVMLKASAGGGGKGMRIIREASQLRSELGRAQSEAQRSFGSSDCILEKYVESSKHVEIQILGDSHGEVVSLFDRDCSVQRRHQKVIEETPCPFLTAETRKRMGEVAVRIAKLIGYEGAGTVEFVFDVATNQFYFLEVNARLQVEHPVTEEVTGLDLVSLQIFVAAGGRLRDLPVMSNLSQTGHAIECRLCAEDPQRDFFPDHGRIQLWRPASQGQGVRYETAIQSGASVSIYFDSMIAKIVVWAPTRSLAIEKLVKELAGTACLGVKTNQLFLQSCLLHKAFHNPAYTTSFIPANLPELLRNPYTKPQEKQDFLSIIPCLYLRRLSSVVQGGLSTRSAFQGVRRQFRNQRFDPVNVHCDIVTAVDGKTKDTDDQPTMCVWKPSDGNGQDLHLYPVPTIDRKTTKSEGAASAVRELTARYNAISRALRSGEVTASGSSYRVSITSWQPVQGTPAEQKSWLASAMEVSINERKILAYVALQADDVDRTSIDQPQRIWCHFPALGTSIEYRRRTLLSYCDSIRQVAAASSAGGNQKTVTAPMPCKILSILKKPGDAVKSGDSVMVIESMKMEVNITVAASGKFQTKWKVGDAVDEGSVLCSVE